MMMAFFLTMPMSRITPMRAMILSSVPVQQGEQRADPGGWQRREDCHRVHQAFVKNPQYQIHGDERCQYQQGLVG